MKPLHLVIFLLVFSGIYFLGNWYVFIRGSQALPAGLFKSWYPWLFWFSAIAFMVGQFLERGEYSYTAQVVTYVGSFWLVFAFYALILIFAIDIVRLLNHFFSFIPSQYIQHIFNGKNLFISVASLSALLVIAGHLNAIVPKVRHENIYVDKTIPGRDNLKIALVSDIHMGFIIGNNRIGRLVTKINNESPDIVLFAGDLVDHNPKPVIKKNLGVHFNELNPPLGKFAVTGNHEYIGDPHISIDYLSKFGIQYLRDTTVLIENTLVLAGRDDREKKRYTGKARKGVTELLANTNNKLPVILMDHQPVEYQAVSDAKVDLMVSGHTHKGQFWPFNYITSSVYENDWGWMKKGLTNFYVSSGYGTWGPPVRIGNRSEIVIINMHLNTNKN